MGTGSLAKILNKTNSLLNRRSTTMIRRKLLQSGKAYVGLGSNIGDRAANLLLAVRGVIDAGLNVSRLSAIYETEPVDDKEQPHFLNMVAELKINTMRSDQMMARLIRVEYALGRRRDYERPKGPRIIDLDLLLYGFEIKESPLLILPHPRMHLRRFVLAPLFELEPKLVHPTSQRTIEDLLHSLEDNSTVVHWRPKHAKS